MSSSFLGGQEDLGDWPDTDYWLSQIFLDFGQEPQEEWTDSSQNSQEAVPCWGNPKLCASHGIPRISSSYLFSSAGPACSRGFSSALPVCPQPCPGEGKRKPVGSSEKERLKRSPQSALISHWEREKKVTELNLLLKESIWQTELWLVLSPAQPSLDPYRSI